MYVSFGAGGATHPLSCFCGGVGSGGLCGYLYSVLEQISCSLHNSVGMNKKAANLFSTSVRSTCGFQCKAMLHFIFSNSIVTDFSERQITIQKNLFFKKNCISPTIKAQSHILQHSFQLFIVGITQAKTYACIEGFQTDPNGCDAIHARGTREGNYQRIIYILICPPGVVCVFY